MLVVRTLTLPAALSLCLACQVASAAVVAPTQARSEGLLPRAQRPLEVRVGEEGHDHLERLVRELADATGVIFAVAEDVKAQLRQTSTGLVADLDLPAAQAWPLVEGLLLHNGFYLTVQSARPPHVVGIVSMIPSRNPVRRPSLRVPIEDVAQLREHPALLVNTVIELPHTDVRQLGNSLRALITDPSGSQSIVPVGNTSSLILSGPARDVLDLVEMLREVDETARRSYEQQREARAGQEPAPAEDPR